MEVVFRKWVLIVVKVLDILLFFQKFVFLVIFIDDVFFEKQLLILVFCFYLEVLGYIQLIVGEECLNFNKIFIWLDKREIEFIKECFNDDFEDSFLDEVQFKKVFYNYCFDVEIVIESKIYLDVIFVFGKRGSGKK